MQLNENSYFRDILSNFLKKNNHVKSFSSKPHTNNTKLHLKLSTYIAFCFFSLFTLTSHAISITSEMSPEVSAEFDKELASQTWPSLHTKLALMDNPYKKFDRAIKKALRKEAPEGKKMRLRTPEETILGAKKMRFDYCQASVTFFVDFSKRAFDLSTIEENPLSKESLMAGNGVAYPFTEAETNSGKTRPTQLALQLGWQYQGKGEQNVETYLATCLAIPVELYASKVK